MTKEQFDSYKFTSKTEVKYDGCWHKIRGVCFDSGIIEFRLEYIDNEDTCHDFINYNEIEDTRQSDEEETTNIDEETIEKIKNRIKLHEEMIEELKLFVKK